MMISLKTRSVAALLDSGRGDDVFDGFSVE